MPSEVWKVFKKVSDTSVKCSICERVLAYKGGSTGSMMNHIKSHHPSKLGPEKSQPSMTSFLTKKNCDPQRSTNITNWITDLIAQGGLPIAFVEGPFREFMSRLEPGYTTPSRETIKNRLKDKFQTKKEEVKAYLRRTEYVAITTDCWTSLNQDGYMTVTAHAIDNDWRKASFVLDTSPVDRLGDDEEVDDEDRLPQRHTAPALQAQLVRVLTYWDVAPKVCAVVHDNASSVCTIGEAVDAPDIPCTAHTLQLCVNTGLNSSQTLKSLMGGASRLVGHFKHSVLASHTLSLKQEQHNLPKHKLMQCVKTRWNSVHGMFERLVEQRWAITSVLSDERVTDRRDARTLQLKEEQWSLMEKMSKVLEPFLVNINFI